MQTALRTRAGCAQPRCPFQARRSAISQPRFVARVTGTGQPAPEPVEPAGSQEAPSSSLQSALGRSLSELSKGSNRISNSTNLLLVGESEETWRKLDSKVNKYPIQRSFTAIGTGGQDFKMNMVQCVSSVVGTVHTECISERHSSQKNYISVTIGPVWVESGDQIIQVYANMKADSRAKWII